MKTGKTKMNVYLAAEQGTALGGFAAKRNTSITRTVRKRIALGLERLTK
jgi:hypothetical protein